MWEVGDERWVSESRIMTVLAVFGWYMRLYDSCELLRMKVYVMRGSAGVGMSARMRVSVRLAMIDCMRVAGFRCMGTRLSARIELRTWMRVSK